MRSGRVTCVALGALVAFLVSCPAARAEINPARLEAEVRWLSDDAREGRGAGTRGLEASADYIESALKEAPRLVPAGEAGYRQPFTAPAGLPEMLGAELTLGRSRLAPGTDFLPLATSDSGRVSGMLALADSLGHASAAGKIAVLLRPGSVSASWGAKLAGLRSTGAIGALVVVDSLPLVGESGAEFAQRPDSAKHANAASQRGKPFVALFVSTAAFARALGLGEGAPGSLPPNAAATMRADLVRRTTTLVNILARVPGSDSTLADSPILISAHYDHLGRGADGAIMSGADDNASGVAALLEIAATLGETPPFPRPIYIAAFSGEEGGLLGSNWFVEHAPFQTARCLAVLNLDTVGRPQGGRCFVLGTGTSTDWPSLLAEARSDSAMIPVPVPESYASSDQWPFARLGVPALQFFSGPNADYHRSTDKPEKLDYRGLAAEARIVLRLASVLANRRQPLAASASSGGAAAAPPAGPARARPWLGSVPDFAWQGTGVRITGVSPGSPAEKVGLRAGDIITGLGGTPVENLTDLTSALREHAAGDTVEVIFLRDGKETRLTVTLAVRPS